MWKDSSFVNLVLSGILSSQYLLMYFYFLFVEDVTHDLGINSCTLPIVVEMRNALGSILNLLCVLIEESDSIRQHICYCRFRKCSPDVLSYTQFIEV